MWLLNSSGTQLINMDHVRRVFINIVPEGKVLVGADFGTDKTSSVGKYSRAETATQLLVDIGQAMADGREFYTAPMNMYDVEMPGKIMDSRVKRRGGS